MDDKEKIVFVADDYPEVYELDDGGTSIEFSNDIEVQLPPAKALTLYKRISNVTNIHNHIVKENSFCEITSFALGVAAGFIIFSMIIY